ncbi:hypothetical protein F4809DRAFT_626753 [Biscogniauxia mediterranea]|nr:hypothetical protein F4809DRAFT_626753 [Biscogniauxia mediterranea]
MRASPQAIIPSSSSSPSSLLNALLSLSLSLLFLPSVLASVSASTASTTVTLTIPPSPQLPNPAALPPSTHATLSQLGDGRRGLLRAPLDASNAFVFRNVTPGSYLGDVHCGAYGFAPLRVDVDVVEGSGGDSAGVVRVWETFRGNDWDNRGEEVKKLGAGNGGGGKAGFPVKVLGPKVYYMERGSFSVFGILKNPMILMGLVSMALFVGLPKLVENMDPEMRAEWEEQQKKNPMASLSSKFQ